MIPVNVSLFHCCTRIMSKMYIFGCYPGHHTHLSISATKTHTQKHTLLNRKGTSTLKSEMRLFYFCVRIISANVILWLGFLRPRNRNGSNISVESPDSLE